MGAKTNKYTEKIRLLSLRVALMVLERRERKVWSFYSCQALWKSYTHNTEFHKTVVHADMLTLSTSFAFYLLTLKFYLNMNKRAGEEYFENVIKYNKFMYLY